jgi:membrane peptidoglycan carboxypeptidase
MSTAGSRTTSVGGVITLLGALLATSLVAGLLGAGLLMPAVGAAGAVASGGVHAFDSLPAELKQSPLAQQSRILAADGSVIATFYDENRIVVPLGKIAKVMQTSLVAIEDDRFYEHGGVDLRGLGRAFVNNAKGGGTQGASTITQQFVKNTLVENAKADGDVAGIKSATDRSGASGYARKLQELKYAVSLEKTMSKDEILQGYLNIAYFGAGTYGVEAAALHYFGVHASKLNLAQSAMLAGLVQSPSHYDPYLNLAAGTARRNVVLNRMLTLNLITQKQHDDAVKSKIVLHRGIYGNDCSSSKYPYFCDYVRRVLSTTEGIGAAALQRGGLTVRTTLQPKAQNAAQKQLNAKVPPLNTRKIGSAATVVQPGTGKIISMVQNTYWPGQKTTKNKKARWGITNVNYNTDKAYGGSSGFQTGSTFKAFTLTAALQEGMTLNDTVPGPAGRVTIPASAFKGGCGAAEWKVANAGDGEGGKAFTLLAATAHSVNTAFANLEARVGLCAVKRAAESMGVHLARVDPRYKSNGLHLTPFSTMTLGVYEESPLTVASAYATFAADGEFCRPIAITAITSATGKKYAAPTADCKQAIDPDIAHGVTKALQGVLVNGTGAGLGIGHDAAGKTGTTNDSKQSWFIGYTPKIATAVWVGQPINARKGMSNLNFGHGISYGGNIFGATIAGRAWQQIMIKIDDVLNLANESFIGPPSSIIGSPPKPPKKPKPTGTPTLPGGTPTGPGGGGGGGGNNCPTKPICPKP